MMGRKQLMDMDWLWLFLWVRTIEDANQGSWLDYFVGYR